MDTLKSRSAAEIRAHRVRWSVQNRLPRVCVVQRRAVETVLESLTRLTAANLQPAAVFLMGASNAEGERFRPARNHKLMHVIGHEAVSDQIDSLPGKVGG